MKTNHPNIEWLLDPAYPGIRYVAMRDLLELPANDPELAAAQKAAHTDGPIAAILEKMHPDGYWRKPGPGYTQKYYSTVWSLIMLGQLGGSLAVDERIGRACAYELDASLTPQGQFTYNGQPSGTFDCLQGNLCTALISLGCEDARLDLAYEYMARSVTGEGVAPLTEQTAPLRFYHAKCGPGFDCGYNGQKPCAWGAAKIMLAFAYLPAERRTPLIERAIRQGVDFLFSTDPARADYPTRTDSKPNRSWWAFGFPVFYVTDILQVVESLVALGYGKDPRLANALQLIREKQDPQGRWTLEYDYAGKTWLDFGPKGQPNPWVTIRAMKILQR